MQSRPHRHALVLGGSIAGLTSARVLSDHFDEVTVIERDALDGSGEFRKGVPQARHAHVVYPTALALLEQLFPGFRDELVRGGSVSVDASADVLWWHWGGFRTRERMNEEGLLQSRWLLESTLRARVRALPRVRILPQTDVLGLTSTPDRSRITGARVRSRTDDAEQLLASELVVDALGRGSATPRWLAAMGYAAPTESEIRVNVGYASRLLRREDEHFDSARALVVSAAPPRERRVAVILPVEGQRWLATLAGWLGDHPPIDHEGWLAFARSLPCSEPYEFLKRAKPLGDIVPHTFPSSRWRHWEKAELPEGFIALGDAMCSFNPIYGQGMSVGILVASELDPALRTADLRGLGERFYARACAIVKRAWLLATLEDLRYPELRSHRPFWSPWFNAYGEQLHRATHVDREVLRAFYRVMDLSKSVGSLVEPHVVARVLAARTGALDFPGLTTMRRRA
jgi:2-polyprenyl-6-methoxyphenol hydroxylase-like FAD-dependent oxidoreductase